MKRVVVGCLGVVLTVCVLPCSRTSASSNAEEHGQELFATKGCTRCHGPNGVGGKKGPDLQLVRKRRTREFMVGQIRDGGQEMPAFGTALTQQEIDDLVSFLRAKRKVIIPPPEQAKQSAGAPQQPQTN